MQLSLFAVAWAFPRVRGGYFYDSTRNRSMRGTGASHAWLEVMVNGYGWYGLDPTNNRVVDETLSS